MSTFLSVGDGGSGAPGLHEHLDLPRLAPVPGATQLYTLCRSVALPLPLASTHALFAGHAWKCEPRHTVALGKGAQPQLDRE